LQETRDVKTADPIMGLHQFKNHMVMNSIW